MKQLLSILILSFINHQVQAQSFFDTSKIMEEVFIRPNRFEKGYNNSVTFLKTETIEHLNLGADVPILLQQIPSLTFSTDAGNGIGYTNLRLRGSDQTRINVGINGIPYNDAESQSVFWVDIADLLSTAHEVQVQRGLGFSVLGAGAFGGNININTFKLKEKASLSFNNSIGSFNTVKNNIIFNSGLINNIFQINGRLSRISSNGYIERASANLYSGNFDWSIHHKKLTMYTTYIFGTENTYQAWNGVSEADLKINRRVNYAGTDFGANTGKPYNNEVDIYSQHNVQTHLHYELNNYLNFKTALFYTGGMGYYEEFRVGKDLLSYGLDSSLVTDLVRRRWLKNDFCGATGTLEYNNLGWKIETTIGWNQYDGDHYGEIVNTFGSVALKNPYRYYFNKGIKTDFTSFIKISKKLNKLLLMADVQYRNIGYMINGTENELTYYATKYHYQFINPKIGINYTLNPVAQINLYAGFGQKEPERTDLLNSSNTVLPEELLDIELGYLYKRNNNNFSFNAFLMNYYNQLVLTGKVNDVGTYYKMNVPKSYRFGMELDGLLWVTKKLKLAGNITWSINKIQSFNSITYTYDQNYSLVDSLTQNLTLQNMDISFSPSFIGYGEVVFFPIKNLALSWQQKYVSSQYLDNTQDDRKKLESYFYHNVNIAYTLVMPKLKEIKFILQLNNIFDKKYESNGYTYSGGRMVDATGNISPATNYNYYYPQAGFNFMFGLNIKL